jgi:ubiquinone biosynthesis protein
MSNILKNIIIILKVLFLSLKTGLFKDLLLLCRNKTKISSARKQQIGKNLSLTLQTMGPAFIKFGQVLSTRSDLLGSIISNELFSLQDKVKAFSFSEVEKIFNKEFGTTIKNKFSHFEQNPVAAASVAQVHRATTTDGQHVAVKILRPNIDKVFRDNLSSIHSLVKIFNFFARKKLQLKVNEVFKTIEKNLAIELNMRLEAAAAVKMKNQCDNETIYIPKIYWDLTTKQILTLEWLNGTPLNNYEDPTTKNINKKLIAKNLSIAFLIQVCSKGFFHADIHPGNIIILENNKLALLDFGIVCSLNNELKHFVTEVVHAFLTKDYKKVTEIHFKHNIIKDKAKEHEFELACISIGEMIVGKDSNDICLSKLMLYLLEVGRKFSMQIKPELLLLHKTILTVEGVGRFIDPEINMWKLATPWLKKWMRNPKRKIEQFELIKTKQKKLFQNMSCIISNTSQGIKSNSSAKNSVEKDLRNLITFSLFLNILASGTIICCIIYYILILR